MVSPVPHVSAAEHDIPTTTVPAPQPAHDTSPDDVSCGDAGHVQVGAVYEKLPDAWHVSTTGIEDATRPALHDIVPVHDAPACTDAHANTFWLTAPATIRLGVGHLHTKVGATPLLHVMLPTVACIDPPHIVMHDAPCANVTPEHVVACATTGSVHGSGTHCHVAVKPLPAVAESELNCTTNCPPGGEAMVTFIGSPMRAAVRHSVVAERRSAPMRSLS